MKIVTPALFLSLVIFLTVGGGVMAGQVEEVTYRTDPDLKGYLCRPEGNGPFPAAIFNHGGLGDIIGGAPEGTCEALAEAGFVGFSPIRRAYLHGGEQGNFNQESGDYGQCFSAPKKRFYP